LTKTLNPLKGEINVSDKLFKDDILFLQRLLKSAGIYKGKLDGTWGPKTNEAEETFEKGFRDLAAELGQFDPRTEVNILTLHLKAQRAARIFLRKVIDSGITARILSGTRTYAEQDKLFRQGRFGNPGARVTNARGGQSNHNFGIAWDIGVFQGGKYLGESPLYKEAALVGLEGSGLEWGGNWSSFQDRPHYQLATGLSTSLVRAKFEKGEPYV
jgi:peptidoglycan LD-endopeptidase CwlK